MRNGTSNDHVAAADRVAETMTIAWLPSTPSTRATFATLMDLDAKLGRAGFHPLSPWWQQEARRFYEGDALTWAARVGRGGAKSTAICKIATNEVINGRWEIPPGECHFAAIVSENVEEASNRLRLLLDFLRTLGIRHQKSGRTIEIPELRLGFKVMACRIGGVSGFRCVFRAADEVAKWSDEGTDPSAEIVASMAAMTVTHPRARSLLFSSPMGKFGLHFDAVERGNVSGQIASVAPSWVANPGISEQQTHDLEPNDRIWKREYAAQPQAAITAVFDPDRIERCFQIAELKDQTMGVQVMLVDGSRGGDRFTWARAAQVYADGKKRIRVLEIGETPSVQSDFTAEAIKFVTAKCKEHGITQVLADQWEAGSMAILFSQAGLSYWSHSWSNTSKRAAVDSVERWMRDEMLLLAEHPMLRKQLAEYSEKITKSGELSYSGRGAHDDYAQVVLLLGPALDENKLGYVDEPLKAAPKHGTPEYWEAKMKADEERMEERLRQKLREESMEADVMGYGGDW